ncbi:hypothetical protein HYPSUDRAFT_486579 [Hypholoma sublateritium FD-334 SS-4]|uniref:Uncharacterized protein n=1 Tax=Hypholoma sublateritium (strain FD-334 SS-4) TaxID=945553 RepID=A0A0D2KGW3_HYPSF|nr:hypothetical protein HYPSUDRAFT_486579 [Hypholoma sublateritium FD-334 SS-4]
MARPGLMHSLPRTIFVLRQTSSYSPSPRAFLLSTRTCQRTHSAFHCIVSVASINSARISSVCFTVGVRVHWSFIVFIMIGQVEGMYAGGQGKGNGSRRGAARRGVPLPRAVRVSNPDGALCMYVYFYTQLYSFVSMYAYPVSAQFWTGFRGSRSTSMSLAYIKERDASSSNAYVIIMKERPLMGTMEWTLLRCKDIDMVVLLYKYKDAQGTNERCRAPEDIKRRGL